MGIVTKKLLKERRRSMSADVLDNINGAYRKVQHSSRSYYYADASDSSSKEGNQKYKDIYDYLRLLLHLLGTVQFAYGAYYYWFHVNHPSLIESDAENKTRWAGKFKYLTFIDVIVQALYHFIALLNDIFGSNELAHPSCTPVLRKLRDFIFSAYAFPLAHFIGLYFWFLYAIDRELVFPKSLDDIFPDLLNHVVHTNVALFAFLDLFTCFRKYPLRIIGLTANILSMIIYIDWLHIVHYYTGQWVYPFLEVLSTPNRYLVFGVLLGFSGFCYSLGEFFNNIIWAPEIKHMKEKFNLM